MRRQLSRGQFSLTMEEVSRLIRAARTFRDKCLMECLYFAGLRRFEAANLDARDVDFERGRLRISGKFGKERVVFVGCVFPQLFDSLKFHLNNRKTGLVFLSNRNKGLALSRINQIVAEAGAAAGLKNPDPSLKYINPHILRHSVINHFKLMGLPIEFAQNYAGHERIETTLSTYGKFSIEQLELMGREKRKLIT